MRDKSQKMEADQNTVIRLRRLLTSAFSLAEIRTLCFDLGIDYDDLGGEGKSGKIRELIMHLSRRKRLRDLVELASRERPQINWPNIP